MKVCTDACLFGAWVASLLKDKLSPNQKVLDIGTGTGLLCLMLSQELDIETDAIEIEQDAFEQSTSNTANSPWHHKIQVIHSDILQFQPSGKYGLVITNPPFFENDLKAKESAKNLARHEASLQLDGLFSLAVKWLSPGGYFAILLPANRRNKAVETGVQNGLKVCNEVLVKQTTTHNPFRVMLLFHNQDCAAKKSELVIKDMNQYTPAFTELLEPYYLQF